MVACLCHFVISFFRLFAWRYGAAPRRNNSKRKDEITKKENAKRNNEKTKRRKNEMAQTSHHRYKYQNRITFWILTHGYNAVGISRWLSGRVLESRSRVCGFEPDCVVSLSKTLYTLLSTSSTQEGPSQHDSKKC